MEVEASALDKEVEEDEYGLYLELPRLLDDHRRVLCEVCGESYTDDSFDMVMCQNAPYTAEDTGLALLEEAEYKCMNGRHFACFPVPIDEAPEGDWYCESCEALREQEAPSRPGATGAQHSTASGSGAGPSRPGRPAKHKHVAGNAKPSRLLALAKGKALQHSFRPGGASRPATGAGPTDRHVSKLATASLARSGSGLEQRGSGSFRDGTTTRDTAKADLARGVSRTDAGLERRASEKGDQRGAGPGHFRSINGGFGRSDSGAGGFMRSDSGNAGFVRSNSNGAAGKVDGISTATAAAKEAARMQLTRQEPATGPLLKTQKPGMQRPASGQPEGPRRAAVAQKDAFSSLLGSMKARAAVEGAGRDESQREQELKARSKRNREQHAQQPHEARAQACLRQRPVWTGQLRAQAPAPHARQDTELADVLLDVVAHALDKPFTTEAAAQLPQALHLSSAVSIAEDLGLRADDESQVYDAAALLFSASHAAANASRSADNIYAVCRMLHEKHQAGRVELGPDAKGMWLALVARPGDGSLNSLWGVLVAPKEQPRRGQAPSVGCLKKGQQQAPDEQAEKQPQAARGRIHWLDNTRVDKRADSCELGPGPIYSAQARGAHDRPQPDLAEQQATGHAAQQACSTLQQEGSTGQQASGRRSMSLAPQLGGTAGHSGGDGDEAMAISTSLGKREREAAADSGDAKRLRLPDAPQPVNPASGAQPKPAPHPRTASAHAQPVGPASIEQPKAGLNPQPVSRQTGSDGEANPMRLRVADAWAGFTADARASKGSIGDGDRDTPALPAGAVGGSSAAAAAAQEDAVGSADARSDAAAQAVLPAQAPSTQAPLSGHPRRQHSHVVLDLSGLPQLSGRPAPMMRSANPDRGQTWPAAHLGQQQPRPQGGRPNAAVWHKPLRGLSYSIPGWPSDEHAAFQLPEKVHVKADRLRRDLHRLGAVWHRIPYPHVRVLCFLEELSRQGFEEADGLADMWVGFRVHPDHRGQNGEPPAEPQDSRSFRLLDFLEHPVRFYKGLSFLERCGTLQREPHPGPELHGCVELFPAGVFVVTDAQTLAAAAESLAPLLALLRRGHLSCAQGSLWQLRLSKTDLATLEVTAPGVAAQLREALEGSIMKGDASREPSSEASREASPEPSAERATDAIPAVPHASGQQAFAQQQQQQQPQQQTFQQQHTEEQEREDELQSHERSEPATKGDAAAAKEQMPGSSRQAGPLSAEDRQALSLANMDQAHKARSKPDSGTAPAEPTRQAPRLRPFVALLTDVETSSGQGVAKGQKLEPQLKRDALKVAFVRREDCRHVILMSCNAALHKRQSSIHTGSVEAAMQLLQRLVAVQERKKEKQQRLKQQHAPGQAPESKELLAESEPDHVKSRA